MDFYYAQKTDSINKAPLKDNGILKETPKQKAVILNAQFSLVFTTDNPTAFPDHTPWCRTSATQKLEM